MINRFLAILALSLLILGCRGNQHMMPLENETKLPRRVDDTSDKRMMRLQKSLAFCGAQVITIGSDYLISIPSSALFPNYSPRLTWESYKLLNTIVLFLKQFRKVAITVTSFTTPCKGPQRDRALTLARARAVGDYLWSQGVDSRFIFTVGNGSDKPIAAAVLTGDGSINSRIEITFRDAII